MRSVAAAIALCGFAHAQTFNSNVEQVAVPVTVSSERNAPPPDLRRCPPLSAADHQMVERLRLVAGGNTTILYDALIEGCGAFTNEMSRRAIFVVSDGVDTSSSATARTVMQRAAEANVAVYAVGVSGRYIERGKPIVRPPDATLRQIAEDTGGRYAYAGTGEGLAQLFASMVEELHQQYMLGFTPAQADGRLHSLIVTTRRPNVTIRARKHYLAPISAQ